MYMLYAVIFAAVWKCIRPTPPKIENTKVQNIETDVLITIEEDGNISNTREIDTITRLTVHTTH